jgi:hypothetical protein
VTGYLPELIAGYESFFKFFGSAQNLQIGFVILFPIFKPLSVPTLRHRWHTALLHFEHSPPLRNSNSRPQISQTQGTISLETIIFDFVLNLKDNTGA